MDKKTFLMKDEHLKLLKEMNVGWADDEFGAPEIDPKRPYGNSGVEQHMLEILGLKELKPGIYEFELNGRKWLLKGEDKYNIYLEGADEEDLCKALVELHKETKTALQVALSTAQFKTGKYQADEYSSDWEFLG